MKLFKHQEEGVKILTNLNPIGEHSFILADEMGTGKTRQGIVAMKTLGGGTLVVTTASSKINWQREINTVYPEDEVHLITKDDQLEKCQWLVINYDMIHKCIVLIDYLIEQGFLQNLIVDEAHSIKGDSLRSKAIIGGRKTKKSGDVAKFSGIAKRMKAVFCLSGTIMLNRPAELFNILKAVNHPLGSNKEEYAKRYCGRFWMYKINNGIRDYTIPASVFYEKFNKPGVKILMRWPDDSGATHLDELREKLQGWIIRRRKEDVLKDLPPKIISIRDFEINEEWQKKYDNAFDGYVSFRKENPIDGWNEENVLMARQLVEVQKLKQVCSLSKVDTIVEDIEEAVNQGQKIIVFSQYTETIKTIASKVEKLGVRTLTGEDKMDKRQEAIDSFQNNPKVKVFVANIKAGGVAINLFAASIVMFADMEWSPGINHQAEDRAHRNGQLNTVNVYYYVAKGTIEEDIVELLKKKRNITDQILEGDKVRLQKSSVFGEFLKRTEVGTK
jgi:SWI/SNF-related matrix-associated actin-dependent regulator 1 of chromatin subfamily A